MTKQIMDFGLNGAMQIVSSDSTNSSRVNFYAQIFSLKALINSCACEIRGESFLKKNVITFVVVVALLFVLCSCGQQNRATSIETINSETDDGKQMNEAETPNCEADVAQSMKEEMAIFNSMQIWLPVKATITATYEGKTSSENQKYEYDDRGIMTYDGFSHFMYENEYDSQGRLIRRSAHKGQNAQISDMQEFDYDSDGHIIRIDRTANGSSTYEECTYDSKGNCVSDAVYDADHNLALLRTIEYDSEGRRISGTTTSYYRGEVSLYTEYEFDEMENIKKATQYYNGEVDSVSEYSYEYDEFGNLVHKKIEQNSSGRILNTFDTYYTYDSDIITATTDYSTHLEEIQFRLYDADASFYRLVLTPSATPFGSAYFSSNIFERTSYF